MMIPVHLMASTNLMPAKLTLTLDNCFDAHILRVDCQNRRIFLRPVEKDDELSIVGELLNTVELRRIDASAIKMSKLFFAPSPSSEGKLFCFLSAIVQLAIRTLSVAQRIC